MLQHGRILLADVKSNLSEYIEKIDDFKIYKISDECYAMTTVPTNKSSLDYVHVTLKGNPPSFSCSFGARCDRVKVSVAKKTKNYSLCSHEHWVQLIVASTEEPVPEIRDEIGKSTYPPPWG